MTNFYPETSYVPGYEKEQAFQYNILKTGDISYPVSVHNQPLWMVDGPTEYMLTGSISTHTAMKMLMSYYKEIIPAWKI